MVFNTSLDVSGAEINKGLSENQCKGMKKMITHWQLKNLDGKWVGYMFFQELVRDAKIEGCRMILLLKVMIKSNKLYSYIIMFFKIS